MNRAMFFYERFLFLSGRLTWNVALAVRLRGPLEKEALEAALAALQRRHPALRAGVAVRNGRPWFVTAPVPPPIPIETTTRRDDETWFGVTWAGRHRAFALPGGPLARLLWIRPPDPAAGSAPTELVLVVHHCICDGSSTVLLMRDLLRFLGEPDRLAPEVAGAVVPAPEPPKGWRWLGNTAAVAAARALAPAAALLPPRRRGEDSVVRWELTDELTAALDRCCRTERATAAMAYAAALLLAFREVLGGRAKNRVLCPVDLRALLPGIGRDRLFAYAEAVVLSLGAETGFWPQARALRGRLMDGCTRLDPARRIALAERLHGTLDGLLRLQLDGRAKQDAVLSVLPPLDYPPGDRALAVTALDAVAAMPWRDATGLTAVRDGGRVRMVLTTRDDLLSRLELERVRDAMTANLVAACGRDGLAEVTIAAAAR